MPCSVPQTPQSLSVSGGRPCLCPCFAMLQLVLSVQCLCGGSHRFQLPQLCLGPVSLRGGKEHPQNLALGNRYPHRTPGGTCEWRSPEMLRVCSLGPWLWNQTGSPQWPSWKSCCSAARLGSTRRDSPTNPAKAPSSCGFTQTTCALQTSVKGQAKAKS